MDNSESFNCRIKREIFRNLPKSLSERQAMIAGIFCGAQTTGINQPVTSLKVAEEFSDYIIKLLALEQIKAQYSISTGVLEIVETAGYTIDEFIKFYRMCFAKEAVDILASDEMFSRSFIRGIYFVGGYITNPNKKYQLELHLKNKNISNLVYMMLCVKENEPLILIRGMTNVFYYRQGDKIVDLLAMIGAVNAVMEFENVRVEHEVKGLVNRQINCDIGNAKRQTDAFVKRRELFIKLQNSDKFHKLSPEMVKIINLHNANEGLSITQLGQLMEPPISKSGMNHRLKKLIEMAEEIDK